MTARAIVTGYFGEQWKQIAKLTSVTVREYCRHHEIQFVGGELRPVARPASWAKLIAIAECLQSYDEVVWLDSDVVVADFSKNIFDEVPDGFSSASCRLTDSKGESHFNTGVWLVRRGFYSSLVCAAMQDDLVHHKWWEQAAINRIAANEMYSLPEEWNVWAGTSPQVHARFRHACGLGTAERRLSWLFGGNVNT